MEGELTGSRFTSDLAKARRLSAAFEAFDSRFVTLCEFDERRKPGHQVLHCASHIFYIAGELRHIGSQDLHMSGKRLMSFCKPVEPFIDGHSFSTRRIAAGTWIDLSAS